VICGVNILEQVDNPLLESLFPLTVQLKVFQNHSPHTTEGTAQSGDQRLLDLGLIIIDKVMCQILFEPDGLFGEGSKEVLQGEGELVELQADGLALGLGVAFGKGWEDCVYG
jgi:hypothetical protein